MNDATIKGMRETWAAATAGQDGSWRLVDANGFVVMFDITRERAQEYSRYYPGSKVVKA